MKKATVIKCSVQEYNFIEYCTADDADSTAASGTKYSLCLLKFSHTVAM